MTYDRIYILSALQFFGIFSLAFSFSIFHFSLFGFLFSIYFLLLFSSDLGALIPG